MGFNKRIVDKDLVIKTKEENLGQLFRADALDCFDARSKANLRLGAELQRAKEDLARVKGELEELRHDMQLMQNVHEEERARVKETLTATLEEQTKSYNSLMAKLRR